MTRALEEQLYNELKDSPRPQYPFPDLVSPLIDQLAEEYYQWIDTDSRFESEKARAMHKRHRLTDLAARAFPWMTLEELRPVARFAAFFAIIDDYMDKSSREEVQNIVRKVSAILVGEDSEPNPGFFHQVHMVRQDALTCGMPQHLYQQFIDSVLSMMIGYSEEKKYNAAGTPPPLPVYKSIRQQTSGGTPFAKYLCMQKNFRYLPDGVLLHPTILRMHDLTGSLIGYHNDFISLPKELARKGDVVNLVMTVQREFGLSLKDACQEALRIHDEDLEEFIRLQNNLPDFGQWQQTAQEYVTDLGIMVQGVYSWHTKSTGRYVPGAYVEPEYKSSKAADVGTSPSALVVRSAADSLRLSVCTQLKAIGFQTWHLGWLCLLFGLIFLSFSYFPVMSLF
ncbi:hypothetical protein ACHAPT_005490 [Fusarium lateritium]